MILTLFHIVGDPFLGSNSNFPYLPLSLSPVKNWPLICWTKTKKQKKKLFSFIVIAIFLNQKTFSIFQEKAFLFKFLYCQPWVWLRCYTLQLHQQRHAVSLHHRRQPLLPLLVMALSFSPAPTKKNHHPLLLLLLWPWRLATVFLRPLTVTQGRSQTGTGRRSSKRRRRSCPFWPFLWPFSGSPSLLAPLTRRAPWRSVSPLTCAMLRM